ncbi:MAG: DUF2490 domain-containing protein [Chitinophagaceae bacterium]|nr:DUF2490 domain-containing protein [Chitinophagaceae bacterium]
MKKTILLVLLQTTTALFSVLSAQTQFTGWLASFNTFKAGKKISIHADMQFRSTDEIKQLQTLLIRPGLNVHLNKYITVTSGYAFISNKRAINNVTGYTPEHRIWEQLLINHKLKNIAVSHRFRIEQRFIGKSIVSNDQLKTDGSLYANRFRYFIRNILPLKKEPVFQKGVFAALQNEVFLNFGDNSNVNNESFDQNRLYIAAGYRLSTVFDLEAGYMNQYINGREKSITNNHVIQIAGYLRL